MCECQLLFVVLYEDICFLFFVLFPRCLPHVVHFHRRLWNEVSLGMFNPRPELWSHPSISKGYDTAVGCICARLATGNVPSGVDHTDGSSKKHRRQNSRRVSECLSSLSDDFEWNNDDSEPFLLNLKGLSSGNLSPESATMTAYVRSNVVSPVEVEMDIRRATEGT